MKTEVLASTHPQAIQRALGVLGSGGLVAFPTDTVYGLGAPAFNAPAVEGIYLVKSRPGEKSIPVLLADPADMQKVAAEVGPVALKLAARFWPGPLTLVVAKHPLLPAAVSDGPTVGVRLPDHPFARLLLLAAGPMAVTSANLSGGQNPTTAQDVLEQLGGRIALILDGGRTPGGTPSTVVLCTGPEPEILRQGPITREQILAALGLG